MKPIENDQRNLAQYGYREASKALNIPASTLRAWTRGQENFEPVFRPAGEGGLSYFNLIEAQVLRAIRSVARLRMQYVREAIDEAQKSYQVKRLLIHKDFRFGAMGLFIERYSKFISLTTTRQISFRTFLEEHLDRVRYDEEGFPRLFLPKLETKNLQEKDYIRIDPFVSFGRSTIKTRPISTQSIVSRIDAGETINFVAEDYEIPIEEVEAAIHYESRGFCPVYR